MSGASDRLEAVLDHALDDELDLLDLAAELKRDRDSYRLLAQVALAHAADLTRTVKRLSETIVRQRECIRSYITPSSTARERRAA